MSKNLRGVADSSAPADIHPGLAILTLIFLPFLAQLPFWLLGYSNDPFWTLSGLSHIGSHGPGSPFLDPNAGYTSEALGRLVAWDWVHGVVPWWNQYTGIGMPLAGEMQPQAFFLPFNLLNLLPNGVLAIRLTMQVLAGLSSYMLLRELKCTRLAAVMGGGLFGFAGTIAWNAGPVGVFCSLPFQPLLLWGIERARKPHGGAASILAIGVAIGWSLLAGFPEPAYISGLLALAYGILRLIGTPNRLSMLLRAGSGLGLGLLIAAPMLLAFVAFLQQSDSFKLHIFADSYLSWHALPVMLLPTIYGPANFSGPTAGPSDLLAGLWGDVGGYTQVLALLLALAGLFRRSRDGGLEVLLAAWIASTFLASFGVQPFRFFFNHLPLLAHAAFYRYAPQSWLLAIMILAAFGLDRFVKEKTVPSRCLFAPIAVLLLLSTALAWPTLPYWQRPHAGLRVMFVLLAATVFWSLLLLTITWFAWSGTDLRRRRALLAGVVLLDAVVAFVVPQAGSTRRGSFDSAAIAFLRAHVGLHRIYSFGPLQANYGAYFQLATINHNVLPTPRLFVDFVDRTFLPGLIHSSQGTLLLPGWKGYPKGTGELGLARNLQALGETGIRYVLTDPGRSPLPPGESSPELQKVYRDSFMDIWELRSPAPYFELVRGGPCSLAGVSREALTTNCTAPATLLRRELYMPGWTVQRAGERAHAVGQMLIFEATEIPAGVSSLQFRFAPPHAGLAGLACAFGLFGLLVQAGRLLAARRPEPPPPF